MNLHPRTCELLNGISPGAAEAGLGDLVVSLIARVDALEHAAAAAAAAAATTVTEPTTTTTTNSTGTEPATTGEPVTA